MKIPFSQYINYLKSKKINVKNGRKRMGMLNYNYFINLIKFIRYQIFSL